MPSFTTLEDNLKRLFGGFENAAETRLASDAYSEFALNMFHLIRRTKRMLPYPSPTFRHIENELNSLFIAFEDSDDNKIGAAAVYRLFARDFLALIKQTEKQVEGLPKGHNQIDYDAST